MTNYIKFIEESPIFCFSIETDNTISAVSATALEWGFRKGVQLSSSRVTELRQGKTLDTSFESNTLSMVAVVQQKILIIVGVEVTDRAVKINHLTQDLTDQQQTIDKFLRHEISMPLATATYFLQRFMTSGDIKLIQNAIAAIQRVTEMTAKSAYLYTGGCLDKINFVAKELIEEALNDLQVIIHESKAVINVRGNGTIIYGDKNRIRQALMNLFENAIKYQPDNQIPELNITICKDDQYTLIRVSDNGIGISKEYWKIIFNPWERLHKQSEKKYSGSGIGLSIVWEVLKQHQGEVLVNSVVGKGSDFTLRFPNETKPITS